MPKDTSGDVPSTQQNPSTPQNTQKQNTPAPSTQQNTQTPSTQQNPSTPNEANATSSDKAGEGSIKNQAINAAANKADNLVASKISDGSPEVGTKINPDESPDLKAGDKVGDGKVVGEDGKVEESSTNKTLKALERGAATYFGGAKGAEMSKRLTDSKTGQAVNSRLSEKLDKAPGVKQVTKEVDELGATDAVNGAVDAFASVKNGDIKGAVKGAKDIKKGAKKGIKKVAKKMVIPIIIGCIPPIIIAIILVCVISAVGSGAHAIVDSFYGVLNFDSYSDNSSSNSSNGESRSLDVSSNEVKIVGKDYSITTGSYLTQSLSSYLTEHGSSIEAFNANILSDINSNGYGTRYGVVAAATSLLDSLNSYGIVLPYYWGGGHSGMINGASATWGSYKEYYVADHNYTYTYTGLDCSGFVSWAIYNGGYNFSGMTSNEFKKIGESVELNPNQAVVQPGDVLLYNKPGAGGHVVLVVKVDNANKKYLVAESAGGSAMKLKYSKFAFNQEYYYGVKLDNYYQNSGNVRS